MILIYQKLIKRSDLKANPEVLYIFGDNEARVGFGGQAGEMREEQNAFGIATLYAPGAPWNDDRFKDNVTSLTTDLIVMQVLRPFYQAMVWPADGIGTGLSNMKESAPKTFAFMQETLDKLGIKNGPV